MSPPGPEACDAVTWLGARTSDDGVVERSFQLMQPGRVVPGVVWLPAYAESSWPVVALGHGGSGHKRNSRNVDLGHWFASRAGIAAVAIDGPHHGDRAATPLAAGESRSRMVSDWNAAIAAVRTLEGVDMAGLGYFGLSMGTRFGLPLAAALGGDLSCAVFGKFGLRAAAGLYEDPTTMDGISADARQISTPTLLHVQWDDELFPRDGQFALFESLGSREKQLIAFPGSHGDTAPTASAMWCDFIRKHLRPDLTSQPVR